MGLQRNIIMFSKVAITFTHNFAEKFNVSKVKVNEVHWRGTNAQNHEILMHGGFHRYRLKSKGGDNNSRYR